MARVQTRTESILYIDINFKKGYNMGGEVGWLVNYLVRILLG